jgi:hypothetical protein
MASKISTVQCGNPVLLRILTGDLRGSSDKRGSALLGREVGISDKRIAAPFSIITTIPQNLVRRPVPPENASKHPVARPDKSRGVSRRTVSKFKSCTQDRAEERFPDFVS